MGQRAVDLEHLEARLLSVAAHEIVALFKPLRVRKTPFTFSIFITKK
jgi:hypothetical protein